MYNAASKAAFLYPEINPKGCIHAVQVDSDINFFIKNSLFTISIHAAHAGSDYKLHKTIRIIIISIHAAHAGSDNIMQIKKDKALSFQSTLPMRAATRRARARFKQLQISIHAAHAGSDTQYHG